MTIEQIKELMDTFNTSDLTKFKLKNEDFELVLEKEKEVVHVGAPQMMPPMPTLAPVAMPVQTAAQSAEASVSTPVVTGHEIKSPMVGTFYNASSPTAKPFVSIGDRVKKGDIICIIEAMKLMNEVESDVDGEVVAILVDNEEMVEFDQPMFVIK